jgi:Di-haem oxidoreductase, putative peroxidase
MGANRDAVEKRRSIFISLSAVFAILSFFNSEAWGQIWDPPAVKDKPDYRDYIGNKARVAELIRIGRRLFVAKFNPLDGAGRPGATGDSKPTTRPVDHSLKLTRIAGPDAMACSSCHNQPAVGGSGDFVANVFVGAHFSDPPTKSIASNVTNERNTIGLFGSGLVEIAARELTTDLMRQREVAQQKASESGQDVFVSLESKGVKFGTLLVHPDGSFDAAGLEGIDYGLVVRPFGVKGVAASLREFSIAALNQHHGIQAIERFGWERTGLHDFDLDGVENEFSIGQLTALVAFQASLPAPRQKLSDDPVLRSREEAGRGIFEGIGCASCHIPKLPLTSTVFLEPNPYNRPGTVRPGDIGGVVSIDLQGATQGPYLEAYTDLKRHNLCDNEVRHFCNEERKQDNVDLELFLTAKLWDVSTSAPYGHRGDLTTLSETILAHGGEARKQREAFLELSDDDKRKLIEFLLSLGRAEQTQ